MLQLILLWIKSRVEIIFNFSFSVRVFFFFFFFFLVNIFVGPKIRPCLQEGGDRLSPPGFPLGPVDVN